MPLTCRVQPSGYRTAVGPWSEFKQQLPGLPDTPDQITEDHIGDVMRREIQVLGGDGEMHTERVSLLVRPDGDRPAYVILITERPPTRTGNCPICGKRGELVEREDASGLTGWVCEDHDALDIVFG